MVNQEIIMQLSMLQQEANKFEEQLQVFEQQILEMQNLKFSLEEIEEDKESEMLANLGKGIYIKTDIKDKNLFVNVGDNTIVKKDISEAKKIIEEQIKKLVGGKEQIMARIMQLQEQTNELVKRAQEEDAKNEKED